MRAFISLKAFNILFASIKLQSFVLGLIIQEINICNQRTIAQFDF